jgi:hypothetical protein
VIRPNFGISSFPKVVVVVVVVVVWWWLKAVFITE